MTTDSGREPDDESTRIGQWMIIAFWLLLLGFGTWFVQQWLEKRELGQIPTDISTPGGTKSVQLEADRWGHYVVSGQINGHQVTFLVDTGASGVSVPSSVANRVGLRAGREFPVSTANGTITVRETLLDELAIGHISRKNVRASINSSMDGEAALLGMTFLRHFELIQKNERLTIREP